MWCSGRGARLVPGDFATKISKGDWLCQAGTATAHVRERTLLGQSLAASYLPWADARIFHCYVIFNTVMDIFRQFGARTQNSTCWTSGFQYAHMHPCSGVGNIISYSYPGQPVNIPISPWLPTALGSSHVYGLKTSEQRQVPWPDPRSLTLSPVSLPV